VAYAYEQLLKVSKNFTIAAAFGNVHGVYKPGNVQLTPKILHNSQVFVEKKYSTAPNPVNFVFHGGSGSSRVEIREAISYGVVKMNIDTDTQWAFWMAFENSRQQIMDICRGRLETRKEKINPIRRNTIRVYGFVKLKIDD